MHLKRLHRLAVALTVLAPLLLLAFGAPATAQEAPAQEDPARGDDYLIGEGDVLQVSIWKSSDLDTEAPVRPDGMISLPLLGDIRVAGLEPATVRAKLAADYGQFIKEPEVSVVVTEIHSRKVFVLGEVAEPGEYDLRRPLRLLQALAMAGGLTPFARPNQLIVLREDGGTSTRFEISIQAITTGQEPGDNLLLRPGDTIVVP